MQKVLVMVSGASGTGKDTLIKMIGDAIKADRDYPTQNVSHLSSITDTKSFVWRMKELVGLDPDLPLTPDDRQALATIKGQLDQSFSYTARHCLGTLDDLPDGAVLLYQVREVGNIDLLLHLRSEPSDLERSQNGSCVSAGIRTPDDLMKVEGIRRRIGPALWVHVRREDADRHRVSSSDVYKAEQFALADILVQNTTLDALQDWADFIARRVNKLRLS